MERVCNLTRMIDRGETYPQNLRNDRFKVRFNLFGCLKIIRISQDRIHALARPCELMGYNVEANSTHKSTSHSGIFCGKSERRKNSSRVS